MTVVEDYYTNKDKTLLIGKLCNNAVINGSEVIGDQTDGAILKFCKGHEGDLERVDEIPLDSNRKMMTTIHRLDGENNIVLSKGAPEIILDKCKHIDDNGTIKILDAETKEMLLEKVGEMSAKALRDFVNPLKSAVVILAEFQYGAVSLISNEFIAVKHCIVA